MDWYKVSGFTGLFNTKDRDAITLVLYNCKTFLETQPYVYVLYYYML